MEWIKVETPNIEDKKLQYDLKINKGHINGTLGKIWLSSNNEWVYELDDDWDWLEAESQLPTT